MIGVLLLIGMLVVVSAWVPRLGPWASSLLAAGPLYGFLWLVLHPVGDGALTESVQWIPSVGVALAFRLDGLSRLFALLVLGVGVAVVVYAAFYMRSHPFVTRFFVLLFAFMGSMLGLVLADDAITLFVFWELTSLSSFLLIGFEHGKESARRAARKALVVTGAGGLALLGAILVLASGFGSFRISEWLAAGDPIAPELATAALILVFIAAFTKSAQFPFHFWLPAAMAGPTPVSAYLHSATMVKGGVYLLARLSPLFAEHAAWTPTLVIVGCFTMVSAAYASLKFDDLKYVLAYTTVMALGLFVALLGVASPLAVEAAVVYLVVHASYKAALFMAAGSIDHATGTRNRSELHGLRRTLPLTSAGVALACASMAGLPPFLGFIGKELAYEATLDGGFERALELGAFVLANVALIAAAALLIRPLLGAKSSHSVSEPRGLAVPALVVAFLGLLFGCVPGMLDPLASSATGAILAHAHGTHLALWHGLTPALVATLVTYALGVGLVLLGERPWSLAWARGAFEIYHGWASRLFEALLLSLYRVSRVAIHRLYPRVMSGAILTVVGSLTVVVFVFVLADIDGAWPSVGAVRLHEAILAFLLIASAWAAVTTRNAVTAFMAAGITGFTLALIYLLFSAPDVAMTQLAVETLTVFLFVLTLVHMPRELEDTRSKTRSVLEAGVAALTGASTSVLLLMLLARPFESEVSEWYLKNSYVEAHGRNVVNVILVDFRAFDTLGEITVLALAGIGVWALLVARTQARTDSHEKGTR